MRQIGIALVLFLWLGLVSLSAQGNELKNNSADFIRSFQTALNKQNIAAFIADNILPESELQLIVDKQNKDMGFSEEDPERFTIEQAQNFIKQMRQGFTKSFQYGLKALKIIDDISPEELMIQDYRVQKSYWEPPVVEIAMRASSGDKELTISMSNLSIVDDRPVLGPSSRLVFRQYEPQDVFAHYIIEALKQKNADYYADNVLTNNEELNVLVEAGSELQTSGKMSSEELYMQTRQRVIEDFSKLIETGKAKGIKWSTIEKTWSGYNANLQGKIYQASIPIQFKSQGKEYRIVLDYCQQLADDTSVFLPGEFKWEGEVK